jgi:nickel transport protein
MKRSSEFQNRKSKIERGVCFNKVPAWFFGLFIVITLAGFSLSAFAHRLSVFAWIEGDTLVVEGKLSGGKRPKKGMVYVYDGEEKLLLKAILSEDGTTRFPLPDYQTGLKIVIDVGEGHRSYWILTPYDIETQRGKTNE